MTPPGCRNPDLLGLWLTGEQVVERTNASTTGLLDIGTGTGMRPDRQAELAALAVLWSIRVPDRLSARRGGIRGRRNGGGCDRGRIA